MKKWTREQEDYLKEIYYGKSNKEIANLINQKFGTFYTASAVSTKKGKKGYKSESKKIPSKWTKEVIDFMTENYEGKDNIELAQLLNDKFNLNTNNDRVGNVKANLKRRKGIDLTTKINRGCYRKGMEPANKGKKWDEYMSKEGQEACKKTCFKKGNIPPNRSEIGQERITQEGYTEVKIQDGALNKNWILKHRYIYEQHYGKIPEGYNVMFADKNRQNFDIDNLILVSKHEDLIMNNKKLIYEDKELTKTGHLVAKVIAKTTKLKKAKVNNNGR